MLHPSARVHQQPSAFGTLGSCRPLTRRVSHREPAGPWTNGVSSLPNIHNWRWYSKSTFQDSASQMTSASCWEYLPDEASDPAADARKARLGYRLRPGSLMLGLCQGFGRMNEWTNETTCGCWRARTKFCILASCKMLAMCHVQPCGS